MVLKMLEKEHNNYIPQETQNLLYITVFFLSIKPKPNLRSWLQMFFQLRVQTPSIVASERLPLRALLLDCHERILKVPKVPWNNKQGLKHDGTSLVIQVIQI